MHDDLEKLEIFVTMAVGIVDVSEGLVRVANAGHCPVIVCQPDGEFTEVSPERPPSGLEKNPVFTEYEIPLRHGMRILAYTDGLVDPRNERPSFHTQPEVAAWFAAASVQGSRIRRSSNPHCSTVSATAPIPTPLRTTRHSCSSASTDPITLTAPWPALSSPKIHRTCSACSK